MLPSPSIAHEDHYCTFFEMCDKDPDDLPTGDMGMPSVVGSELGMCKHCPAFTFLSKTEKERHLKVFHPYTPQRSLRTKQGSNKEFICKHKDEKDKVCGLNSLLVISYLNTEN